MRAARRNKHPSHLLDIAQSHGRVEIENRAGFHQLIVGDRNIDDRGGDLSADLHRAGIDERVIGRLIVPGIQPPGDNQAKRKGSADV